MKHWKTVSNHTTFSAADKKRDRVKKNGKETRVRKRERGYDVRVVDFEDESTFCAHTISGKARKSFKNNRLANSRGRELLDEVLTPAVKAKSKKKEKQPDSEKAKTKSETRQARRKREKKEEK